MSAERTGLWPEVRVGANPDALAPISAAARSFRPDAIAWLLFALVLAGSFALDRVSKDTASERLALGSDHRLFGPLSLTHTTNSGIAFGLFEGRTSIVAFLGLVVVSGLFLFFARVGGEDARLAPALGLLIGGSMGNLSDRVRFGRVTDFVELRYSPSFNLADVFIIGGVLLLLLILTARDEDTPSPPTGRLINVTEVR